MSADLTFHASVLRNPATEDRALAATRLLMFGLGLYIVVQGYMIPLAPLGPKWAIWPRLADVAFCVLCLGLLKQFPVWTDLPLAHRQLVRLFAMILLLCLASFIVFTIVVPGLNGPSTNQRSDWGLYQLARLAQFLVILFAVSAVDVNESRRRRLAQLSTFALLFALGTVFLNHLRVLPYETIVAHLPSDPDVSGPWANYGREPDSALGTLGYDHAYVACQLLLLLALRMGLTRMKLSYFQLGLMLATFAAIFFSASRAGFAGMLVFGVACLWIWARRGHSRSILGLQAAGVCAIVLLAMVRSVWTGETTGPMIGVDKRDVVSRQFTTLKAYRSENLSGRTDIWARRIEFLNERPLRWLFGSGFGAAVASGKKAHLLALHTLLELGVVGLLASTAFLWAILSSLWKSGPIGQPIFWVTVALLATSLAQDTFYPIPLFGHFIGTYLIAVVLTLRMSLDLPQATAARPNVAVGGNTA